MHRAASFIQPLRTIGLGLGLVLAVLSGRCLAADWSLPDSRMGIRTAPLLLMTRPDVQADLKLEAEQIASLYKTIEELSQRAQALRGKTGPEVVAERRSIDDAQGRWLTENLREDQLGRLGQIDLQWEGSSALISRPSVVDTLKLTPTQVHELTGVISERNAHFFKSGYNPAEESETRRKSLAVLTNPQLQAWNSMLGERCHFTTAPPAEPGVQQAGHEAPH
jgi:hypothetical protein